MYVNEPFNKSKTDLTGVVGVAAAAKGVFSFESKSDKNSDDITLVFLVLDYKKIV